MWNDIEIYQKAMTWSRGWLHWLPAIQIDLKRCIINSIHGNWKIIIIFKQIDTLLFWLRYYNERQSSWIIIFRSFCHGQSNSCSSGNMTLKGMPSYLFAFDLSMKPFWIDEENEYRTLTHTHTKYMYSIKSNVQCVHDLHSKKKFNSCTFDRIELNAKVEWFTPNVCFFPNSNFILNWNQHAIEFFFRIQDNENSTYECRVR